MRQRMHKSKESSEETANHSTTDIAGQATCAESVGSQIGSLAELVASGESQGVGDGEDNSDDCNKQRQHDSLPLGQCRDTYQPNSTR